MNIFYLSPDCLTCAQYHVDKHVVKMILEYTQLLSTAHRMLDGTPTIGKSKTGRNVKRWILPGVRDSVLYQATHINHPSAVWTRKSKANYLWLYTLLDFLCEEYTHRYEKVHKVQADNILGYLYYAPKNIPLDPSFTEPPPAMPDEYKVMNDSVASYRNYYIGAKSGLAKWKNREIPTWFVMP